MNLVSHFFLDKDRKDRFFFVGVCSPDLVSNFNRKIRLKKSSLPLLRENEITPDQLNFYQGVLRHFEVDRLFHSSPFFKEETAYLTGLLKTTLKDFEVKRAFFVAHIMLELVLDRVLIRRHKDLLLDFYKNFQQHDVPKLVQYTEWLAQEPMAGYDLFLQKFASRQFLYRYVDLRYLSNVLRNILQTVGIENQRYLHEPIFFDLMKQYENRLADLYEPAMQSFAEELTVMK